MADTEQTILAIINQLTPEQQEKIFQVVTAANPEIDGSLMHELNKRGVAELILTLQAKIPQHGHVCRGFYIGVCIYALYCW